MALDPFADQLKCQSGPPFSHFCHFLFSVDIYAQFVHVGHVGGVLIFPAITRIDIVLYTKHVIGQKIASKIEMKTNANLKWKLRFKFSIFIVAQFSPIFLSLG